VVLTYPGIAASLPKDNFKNKVPRLCWQRTQVAGAPQPSGDQVGFETNPANALKESWEKASQEK
jgi:hypothetical protein